MLPISQASSSLSSLFGFIDEEAAGLANALFDQALLDTDAVTRRWQIFQLLVFRYEFLSCRVSEIDHDDLVVMAMFDPPEVKESASSELACSTFAHLAKALEFLSVSDSQVAVEARP